MPPLNLIGDFGGGALYAVYGILAALHERQRSGEGQVIDIAMAEGALSLLTSTFGYAAAGIHTAQRGHNLLDGGVPYYGIYETADRRYVTLAPLEPGFFAEMLDALGLDRSWLQRRTRPRTLACASGADCRSRNYPNTIRMAGPCLDRAIVASHTVLPLGETGDYPQFAERGSVVTVDGIAQARDHATL